MEQTRKYTQELQRFPNRYFQDFQEKLTKEWTAQILEKVYEQVQQARDFPSWKKAILFWNEVKAHLGTHFELVELAFNCHTDDKEIEREERRLKEEVEPVIDEWSAKIRELVLKTPERKAISEAFSPQYFKVLEIQQQSFHPDNIPIETQLHQVLSDYTKLTGGATFEVDGKKYPLSQYKKFSSSTDPKLREQSFRSYSGWFLKNRAALEDIYDKSIRLRQKMAKNLGYENFIPMGYLRMHRTDYGPEEVAAFRKQIREVLVPVATKIRQAQAKALGTPQVKVQDLDFFPQWQHGDLKVEISEQPDAAQRIYEKISPELASHFQTMRSAGLLDLEAREGKGPGAFCTDFSDYRVPFLFLNSVGEATDLTTMLHESGHSFQAWESRSIDLIELRWPTLDACEVHSMSMEFLAYPYYEEFFSHEDAERFRKRHVADSFMLLPYIAMVDEFQHLVYSGQAEGPEGRAKAWEQLEQTYLSDIDFSAVPDWRRHRWIRQLHIFRAPFYYIDYAIAQTGAWQIWAQSVSDREAALENYLKLCKVGGSLPLKQFFQAGNLKLPFESGVLQELVDQILKIQPIF